MKKTLGILLALTMLFTMCMPAMAEVETALELDYAALTRNSILTVPSTDATLLDNLNLPTVGANGSTIAWASSDSSVISNTGVVTRPDFTKSVNLTATLENGEETMEKVFSFRVLGKNESIDSAHPMPAKGELIRKDDFNDNSIDSTTITTSGTVVEEGGKLHLSGAKGTSTSARVFLAADQTALSGKIIVEYTVKKADLYGGVQIGSNPDSGDYGYAYWRNYNYDGDASNDIANESISLRGGDSWVHFAYDAFGAPSLLLKFTVLYDTEAGTYETWINNRYAGKRTQMSANKKNIRSVAFMNIADLAMDCEVDDFACYMVKEDTVGMVLSEEKFDGSTVPARVEQKGATAPVVTGGALKLTSASAETAANIYLNDGKSPMVGKFAIEFSVKRTSSSGTLDIYFKDAKNGDAVILRSWNNSSGVMNGFASTKGGANSYSSLGSKADSLDVRAEFDTVAQTVKLSVNGNDASGYTISGKNNIAYVQFYNFAASELTIDNFKVTSLEENIEKANVIYKDSFSDGVLDAELEKSANLVVTEANGALNISKGTVKKLFNTNSYASTITEDFVAEISLKGPITENTHYYFYGNSAGSFKSFARISWYSTGIAYVFNGEETKSLSGVGTDSLHIKVALSLKDGRFSVWINGTLVADNVKCQNQTTDIAYFMAETGSNSGVSIDEIFFYNIKDETPATVSELSIDYNAFDKKVSVLSPNAGNALAIAASYMGDVMIDAKLVPVTLAENGSVIADTSGLITAGADKVRVYLWNDTSTLVPMCEPKDVTGVISAY